MNLLHHGWMDNVYSFFLFHRIVLTTADGMLYPATITLTFLSIVKDGVIQKIGVRIDGYIIFIVLLNLIERSIT